MSECNFKVTCCDTAIRRYRVDGVWSGGGGDTGWMKTKCPNMVVIHLIYAAVTKTQFTGCRRA